MLGAHFDVGTDVDKCRAGGERGAQGVGDVRLPVAPVGNDRGDGAVVGVALMAFGKRSRGQRIPFGPFLAAGALTIILIGQPLIDAYR